MISNMNLSTMGRKFVFLAIFLFLCIIIVSLTYAQAKFADHEFILKFTEEAANNLSFSFENSTALTGIESIDDLNRRFEVQSIERVFRPAGKNESRHEQFGLTRIYRFTYKSDIEAPAVCEEYKADLNLEYVHPNYKYELDDVFPNDPSFDVQWGLHNTGQTGGTPDADIDAPEAWQIEKGNSSVIVGIIDTGRDLDHPDLVANAWINTDEIPDNGIDDDGNGYVDDYYGYDVSDDDSNPDDYHGHGSHCSGIVSMVTDNGVGGAGTTWYCKVMAVKVFPNSYDPQCAEGIVYAADNGAIVLSNSWGNYSPSPLIYDAIVYAQDVHNCVTVFAAGNDNTSTPHYPSYYEENIAVAATNHYDDKAWFSNYGDWVDIAAPGENIFSCVIGGYDSWDGTSMATPFVAGVAGLVISQNPGLSHEQVRAQIESTADDIGDPSLGSGRLNAHRALISEFYTISGQVRDVDTGIGIEDATVEYTGPASGSVHTDPDGNYIINVPEGTYNLMASAYGYCPESTYATVPPDHTGVDFELDAVDIAVDPTEFDVSLEVGETTDRTMTICNEGCGLLEWSITVQPKVLGFPEKLAGYDPDARTTKDSFAPRENPIIPSALGDIITSWPAPSPIDLPWGVGWDREDVWISDPLGHMDGKDGDYELTTGGTIKQSWPTPWAGAWPGDMANDPESGYIFQVNVGGDNGIYKLDYSGNELDNIGGEWDYVSARGLAYDKETDEFYIGGWNHTVIYVVQGFNSASPGATIRTISTAAYPGVSGLCFCSGNPDYPDGVLWIATNDMPDMIYMVDPSSGAIIKQFGHPEGGDYGGAGLALNNEGNLWMVSQNTNTVYLIDSETPCEPIEFWLTVEPKSGEVNEGDCMPVNLHFDADDMPNGHYYADIVIQNNDPDENPFPVLAHLEVHGQPYPNITVTPSSFAKTMSTGDVQVETMEIGNTGVGTLLVYEILDGVGWLEEDPNKNIVIDPGDTRMVDVTFNTEGHVGGIYNTEIHILNNMDHPDTNVQVIPVQLTVLAPDIAVDPEEIDERVDPGTTKAVELRLDNLGDWALGFSARVYCESPGSFAESITITTPVDATDQRAKSSKDFVDAERSPRSPTSTDPSGKSPNWQPGAKKLGEGDIIKTIPAPSSSCMGMGYGEGSLWVASNASDPVKVYQVAPSDGTVLSQFTAPFSGYVLGLTYDYTDGTLWIVQWYNWPYEIHHLTRSGTLLGTIDISALWNPRGLTFDGEHLWVSDASEMEVYQIRRTYGSMDVVRVESVSGILDWSMDLAWTCMEDQLWANDDATQNDINGLDVSVSPPSLLTEFPSPEPDNVPEGLAWDGQYLWWCSFYGTEIYQIDADIVCCTWLSVDPPEGEVPPASSTILTVHLDATEFTEDTTLYGSIEISSNDPDEPTVTVPVTMTVGGGVEVRLWAENAWGSPGTTDNPMDISLENEVDVYGVQFTAVFDGSLLTATDAQTTARSSDMTIAHSIWSDSIKVLLYGPGGEFISAGTGHIVKLLFDVAESAPAGDSTLVHLKDAKASDEDGNPLAMHLNVITGDGWFHFGKKGDINGDGEIDIFDLVKLINFILEKPPAPTPYQEWAADMNDDGELDIFDVVKLINCILYGCDPLAIAKMAVSSAYNAELSLPDVALIPEQATEVPIYATFDGTVAGVQLALRYDPQTLKVSTPVLTSRTDQMELATADKDGKLTVLIYSSAGNVIEAGSDPILNLHVETLSGFNGATRLEVDNAIAVNGKAEAISVNFSTGNIAAAKPKSYLLAQNYPNPFNSETRIKFELPENMKVTIKVYNLRGEEVRTLVDKDMGVGYHSVIWDGRDKTGSSVATGVYIYRMDAGSFTSFRKMAFLK